TTTAKNAYRFGQSLGTLDKKFTLLKILLTEQKRLRTDNAFFISGYFAILFERDRALWESTLDKIAADTDLCAYVAEITWRSGMTDRAALRVLSILEAKLIPTHSMRMFTFGGVASKVSEDVFRKWLNYLLGEGSRLAASIALHLFFFYYTFRDRSHQLPR